MNAAQTSIDQIPTETRKQIMDDLRALEQRERVRILFAIESGSRAWGFPSPDSDFDARFVYVHEPDWYLQLVPRRDVIELPIRGELDINGWDIQKALQLLLKPNPVLLEWLCSPIRYIWADDVCLRLQNLAARTSFGMACLHHYASVAKQLRLKYIDERELISPKRYLYILRAALCVAWLREAAGAPPMNFHELASAVAIPAPVRGEIDQLLEAKAKTSELGLAPRNLIIEDFVKAQLDWAATAVLSAPKSDLRNDAETLFRDIVRGAA